jgi:hypothetical protein
MITMSKEFKDWFTLDGRLTPPAGVTKRKVEAVRELVEKALRGNRIAAGTLQEAVTTSDASLNLAYLVNLNVLPQYDEAPRVWTQIAGTRPLCCTASWGSGKTAFSVTVLRATLLLPFRKALRTLTA